MSVSIDDSFEPQPFRSRLARAAKQYSDFGRVWGDYLERRPHRLITSIDQAGHGTILLVEDEPIPADLSMILGEFLYQLRAALDNCIYEIAIIDSGTNPPPNGDVLEWPICTTPEAWVRQQRRLSQLSPRIREALENIQPYKAEAPGWNCLRILHGLARKDRHRTVHLVTSFVTSGSGWFDVDHVEDLQTSVGIVPSSGLLATFKFLGDGELERRHLDLDFVFEVEIEMSPHPGNGVLARPWGSLDARLQALLKAVFEYTEGLHAIALETRREQP